MEDALLTPSRIAEIVGMSSRTLNELIKRSCTNRRPFQKTKMTPLQWLEFFKQYYRGYQLLKKFADVKDKKAFYCANNAATLLGMSHHTLIRPLRKMFGGGKRKRYTPEQIQEFLNEYCSSILRLAAHFSLNIFPQEELKTVEPKHESVLTLDSKCTKQVIFVGFQLQIGKRILEDIGNREITSIDVLELGEFPKSCNAESIFVIQVNEKHERIIEYVNKLSLAGVLKSKILLFIFEQGSKFYLPNTKLACCEYPSTTTQAVNLIVTAYNPV